MPHKRSITASAMERSIACPASQVLPWVKTSSDAADHGIAIHEFVAEAFAHGRDAALSVVADKYRAACEAIDLGSIRAIVGDGKAQAELAMAYDVRTDEGRVIGEKVSRQYGRPDPHIIYGTADLIVAYEKRGLVADYKTGVDVAPPKENAQLKTLAVMAAKAFGWDTVDVAIIYLRDGRTPPVDMATMDALDLEVAASEMRRASRRVLTVIEAAQEVPDVSPGSHCRYCPALPHCPAHTALVRNLSGEFISTQALTKELTPERAAKAWEQVKTYRMMLDQLEDGLKAYARQQPIMLSNGKVLAEQVQEREEIDPNVAYTVIANDYSLDLAGKAVEQACTKASITRALKKDAVKAIDAIRAAGGIRIKTVATVRELAK